MSPRQALAFVKKHGVVLQAARGPVPSLAEAVAGERIRGSWWSHPKGREIYRAADLVCESPDVLVCRLVEGKISYVHRRLWPALVKLAARFPRARLAKVWDEHTATGAHRSRRLAFPHWVPAEVAKQARDLPLAQAHELLSPLLASDRGRRRLGLRAVVGKLRRHYGSPPPLPTADPFELVLWDNVAYLASPPRRREAFELLEKTIGTKPTAILEAPRGALEKVTAKGILKSTFAAKLRECARTLASEFGGDLDAAVRLPLEQAKRALRRFPGIGEPGAEKILLFSGRHALLAPDSNALRVLVRLGSVRESSSYAGTYAAAREAGAELSGDVRLAQQAHLLLQHHGQTLCKRSVPLCPKCPLAGDCAYARRKPRPRTPRRPQGARR